MLWLSEKLQAFVVSEQGKEHFVPICRCSKIGKAIPRLEPKKQISR